MTFKEKLKKEHPEKVGDFHMGGCYGCPDSYGYEECSNFCRLNGVGSRRPCGERCTACWNREIPGTDPVKHVLITTGGRGCGKSATIADYILHDILETKNLAMGTIHLKEDVTWPVWPGRIPDIKQVIFNDPATIVIWADGEKTVVKCQNGEPYDPEKGLAMAITKRALGNKGNYFDEIKKWTKEYESEWQKNTNLLLKERGVLTMDDVCELRKEHEPKKVRARRKRGAVEE